MKKAQFRKGQEKGRFSLSKIGILVLALLCIGVLIYDMFGSDLRGSLPAEAPVAGMLLDPETIPEPDDGAAPQTQIQVMEADDDAAVGEDQFYAEYRLQREKVRAEELELLQGIIDDVNSSTEMRDTANKRKMAIAQNMEYELMTENVLYAKSFGETVVMLGKDTATVVLTGLLDEIKAAQVAEAVSGVTGVKYENVIIINR